MDLQSRIPSSTSHVCSVCTSIINKKPTLVVPRSHLAINRAREWKSQLNFHNSLGTSVRLRLRLNFPCLWFLTSDIILRMSRITLDSAECFMPSCHYLHWLLRKWFLVRASAPTPYGFAIQTGRPCSVEWADLNNGIAICGINFDSWCLSQTNKQSNSASFNPLMQIIYSWTMQFWAASTSVCCRVHTKSPSSPTSRTHWIISISFTETKEKSWVTRTNATI